MKLNWKPTPLKVALSVIIAIVVLLGIIKTQTCPERQFELCGGKVTLHEPVWGCTFYCTTPAKNYFLYVMEMGVPFLVLFMTAYLIISRIQHSRKMH